MCQKASDAVIDRSQARGADFTLLLIIASSINKDTGQWAWTNKSLANKARMCLPQFFRHRAALVKLGELQIERKAPGYYVYRTPLYQCEITPDKCEITPDKCEITPDSPSVECEITPDEVGNHTSGGVKSHLPTPVPNYPNITRVITGKNDVDYISPHAHTREGAPSTGFSPDPGAWVERAELWRVIVAALTDSLPMRPASVQTLVGGARLFERRNTEHPRENTHDFVLQCRSTEQRRMLSDVYGGHIEAVCKHNMPNRVQSLEMALAPTARRVIVVPEPATPALALVEG